MVSLSEVVLEKENLQRSGTPLEWCPSYSPPREECILDVNYSMDIYFTDNASYK